MIPEASSFETSIWWTHRARSDSRSLHGWWHWVHVGVRAATLSAAGVIMVRYGERSRDRESILWVALGIVLALSPALLRLSAVAQNAWTDQTPAGFALGAAALVFGIARRRFLDLGPVARTLVMDQLRDPIIVMDGRGRIVDANRAAERNLGLRPYEDVPVALGTFWASSRQENVPATRLELDVPGDEQRTYDVMVSRMGRGRTSGHTALLLIDITERERMHIDLLESREALRRANADLERLANTDGLTGLANRRHFMEELGHEVERAQRYDRPLSLVLLDLDHFKQVNDTHGHAAGDQVLCAAAGALRGVCRDADLAGRIGGEELALLLPETWPDGGRRVGERVRERIEAERHRAPSGAAFRVTGSIGVASSGARCPRCGGIAPGRRRGPLQGQARGTKPGDRRGVDCRPAQRLPLTLVRPVHRLPRANPPGSLSRTHEEPESTIETESPKHLPRPTVLSRARHSGNGTAASSGCCTPRGHWWSAWGS